VKDSKWCAMEFLFEWIIGMTLVAALLGAAAMIVYLLYSLAAYGPVAFSLGIVVLLVVVFGGLAFARSNKPLCGGGGRA
jgi:hypothetical protein